MEREVFKAELKRLIDCAEEVKDTGNTLDLRVVRQPDNTTVDFSLNEINDVYDYIRDARE